MRLTRVAVIGLTISTNDTAKNIPTPRAVAKEIIESLKLNNFVPRAFIYSLTSGCCSLIMV